MPPDPLPARTQEPERVTLYVCDCGRATTSPYRCPRGHEHRSRQVEYVRASASPQEGERELLREIAARGCCINRTGWFAGSCIDYRDSARAAVQRGEQPSTGPRWGFAGSTGAFRDRIAAGEGMCDPCRASEALAASPTPDERTSE